MFVKKYFVVADVFGEEIKDVNCPQDRVSCIISSFKPDYKEFVSLLRVEFHVKATEQVFITSITKL